MRQQTGGRKRRGAPTRPAPARDEMTMVAARDVLGDVVMRARMAGRRTVLTKNGKPAAAVVSMKDLEILEARDARLEQRAPALAIPA